MVLRTLTKLFICPREYNYDVSSWESDEDMSKNINACFFSTLPAHASLNILQTGTCEDYSIVLTTLLRKAGYSSYEIMSANGEGHAYNLVKLPGDDKYHFVDTTGNQVGSIKFKGKPKGGKFGTSSWYDYCKLTSWDEIFGCWNDNGRFKCPPKSEVYGC